MKQIACNIKKIKKTIYIIVFCLGCFVLLFNIISSQTISPLYFGVINSDKKAVVDFLKIIKPLSSSRDFLRMNKNIYGQEIENKFFYEDRQKKATIEKLEKLLEKNPLSRDLLYNLSLLYHEDGNMIKAKDYLRKAREIDPSL